MLIELEETGAGSEVPLTPAQGRLLASSGVATAVPSPYRDGYWRVTPAGKVGAAAIGGVEIHIRPKVTIPRLLFLAGYARHGTTWRSEAVHAPEADGLVPALAQILWRQAEQAIRQGLLPGYLTVEEASPVLRGRLRETAHLHRHHGLPLPLEIRHDEFTTDIPENRILRSAIERMLTVPGVDPQSALMLRRTLRAFADVTPIPRGDPIPVWLPARLNARYHAALRIAELVLRAASVELGAPGVIVNGFLLDMPLLFEEFVTTALREQLEASFGGRVAAQYPHSLDEAGRVRLRPDIVWKRGSSVLAVVDAKYKAEQPAGYPNADLYQLLAYATVLGLRSGHLVYARGSEERTSHVVRLARTELVCHAIDLDRDPAGLLDQMCELAGTIADAAAVG